MYISILRGINVSGQKKVPMADLRKVYESLGLQDVSTYIQSGNVIFSGGARDETKLVTSIEKAIEKKFGFHVPVMLRTDEQWKHIIAGNPFLSEEGVDETRLYVTILDEEPSADLVRQISEKDFGADRFVVKGKEVYIYCPVGYGNTKINNNFFEKKLKVGATTRNWKTMNTLAGLVSGL
ncbi:MAG: DUF1697 domain-containing protein [Flavobacteriales bacterium]|nr:DUF1697 domain-containing protein [Flavobacteriales bacterium]